MKIRTDFVTNSSSSSFTLVINFELSSGKNVRFVAAGLPDDCQGGPTEDPDYYGDTLEMDAGPKDLGKADSVRELIDILKENVFDGDEQIFMKSNPKSTRPSEIVDDDGLEDEAGAGKDAYRFIETIQKEIVSMDDIARITVEGNEDYGYQSYRQSYTYDRKTGRYTGIEENAYDDEIEGYHGGELMFDTPRPSDMQYLSEDDESGEIVPRSVYPLIRPIEGTGYAGRTERIEKMKVGDLVVLKEDYNAPPSVYSMNKEPVLRIEVFNKKNETLGYVSTYEPPYSFDIIKDLDRLGARVVSVTPRSARGPRARIALMDIELFIKNEDIDK